MVASWWSGLISPALKTVLLPCLRAVRRELEMVPVRAFFPQGQLLHFFHVAQCVADSPRTHPSIHPCNSMATPSSKLRHWGRRRERHFLPVPVVKIRPKLSFPLQTAITTGDTALPVTSQTPTSLCSCEAFFIWLRASESLRRKWPHGYLLQRWVPPSPSSGSSLLSRGHRDPSRLETKSLCLWLPPLGLGSAFPGHSASLVYTTALEYRPGLWSCPQALLPSQPLCPRSAPCQHQPPPTVLLPEGVLLTLRLTPSEASPWHSLLEADLGTLLGAVVGAVSTASPAGLVWSACFPSCWKTCWEHTELPVCGAEFSWCPVWFPGLNDPVSFSFFNIYLPLFTWLCWVLIAACGIFSGSVWDFVPWPGLNPGPLHWKHGVSVTGPPWKSL